LHEIDVLRVAVAVAVGIALYEGRIQL